MKVKDNDEASIQALVEDCDDGTRSLLKQQILETAASVGSTEPKFDNYNIFCANLS